jgi:6-pyruvoyltetrahydropterin/6-carboxytetrahydropterin synthase
MKIGKTFTFEAAHRLQGHKGKCKNLHGHSYKVEVSAAPVIEMTDPALSLETEGSSRGMLFDFDVLTEWWKAMDSVLDHTTILEEGDPLIPALAGAANVRMTLFPWPPTAEHLAIWISDDLAKWLDTHVPRMYITTVRVWETAKSWAEV